MIPKIREMGIRKGDFKRFDTLECAEVQKGIEIPNGIEIPKGANARQVHNAPVSSRNPTSKAFLTK